MQKTVWQIGPCWKVGCATYLQSGLAVSGLRTGVTHSAPKPLRGCGHPPPLPCTMCHWHCHSINDPTLACVHACRPGFTGGASTGCTGADGQGPRLGSTRQGALPHHPHPRQQQQQQHNHHNNRKLHRRCQQQQQPHRRFQGEASTSSTWAGTWQAQQQQQQQDVGACSPKAQAAVPAWLPAERRGARCHAATWLNMWHVTHHMH